MRLVSTLLCGATLLIGASAQAQDRIVDSVDAPVPKPAPGPIEQEPEVVRLLAQMDAAALGCNRVAWAEAREALFMEVAARLETENDRQQRVHLNMFRNGLRRREFPACTGDEEPAQKWEGRYAFELVAGAFRTQPVGTGVVREGPVGTPERYGTTTGEKIAAWRLSAHYDTGKVRFGGGYLNAIDKADYSTPAGQGSGMTFGKLSEANTSGYFAEFGLTGDTEAEFDILWAELMVTLWGTDEDEDDYDEEDPREGARFDEDGNLIIRGVVKYEFEWGDYRSTLRSSGTVGGTAYSFGQDRAQQVRQQSFTLGIDLETGLPVAHGIFLRLNARGGTQYLNFALDSAEHNTASYGPASTRDWRFDIRDKGDGFGFEGKLQANLFFKLGPSTTLAATIGADYWSQKASVRNPVDGDEVYYDGRSSELQALNRSYLFGGISAGFRF